MGADMMQEKNKKEQGAAMMLAVIFFVVAATIIVLGMAGPAAREYRVANTGVLSRQSYFLAESGLEDAFYRVRNGKALASPDTLTLGGNSTTTTTTALNTVTKQIASLAAVLTRDRTAQIKIKNGTEVIFQYGTQAGQGGVIFSNNAYLSGSLYSNGTITGSNGAYITGNAYSATSSGSATTICVGGTISGGNCTSGASPTGDLHAHTVTSSKVTGTLYCQSGTSNNKSCNTSAADPASLDMPITSANITAWKNDAAAGTVITGDYTVSSNVTLGPAKIVGNLTISGAGNLTIANTIWVTGNVTFSGTGSGSNVKLAASYGSQSGIIVADGLVNIGNNVTFQDSGTTGSYIMLLTTSTCDESTAAAPCSSTNAIEVNNNASIVIANAESGTVNFSNNSTVKEVVGKTIRLKNNVGVNYGLGSLTVGFASGTGGWNLSTWTEI